MAQLIDKSVLIEEIDKLLFKNKYHNDYDCGFRDGNNAVIRAIKGRIDALEVKEVDLKKEINKFIDSKEVWKIQEAPLTTIGDAAKHFFELGLKTQKGE